MQKQFIVSHDDKEIGPLSKEEISLRIKAGELSVIDFAYVEEKRDWVTLLELLPDANPTGGAQRAEQIEPVTQVSKSVDLKVVSENPVPVKQEQSHVHAAPKEKKEHKEARSEAKIEAKPESKSSDPVKNPQGPSRLDLKGGIGSIDLTQFKSGVIQLRVSPVGSQELECPQGVTLNVKPAEAQKIKLSGPAESIAGQPCVFHLEAVDKYGNCDSSFMGSITLSASGSAQGGGVVRFKSGRAQLTISNKVAERYEIKMVDSEKSGLDTSARHTCVVKAGPAAKFVLASPQEVVAGQSATVTVKAVDAFGNVATDFSGPVMLEVNSNQSDSAKKVAV